MSVPFPIDQSSEREARRKRTLWWGLIRHFVTGGDAFYTVVKAGYVISFVIALLAPLGGIVAGTSLSTATAATLGSLLSSALIPVSPVIITLGLLGSIIYILSGRKEERDLNREEEEKETQLRELQAEVQTANKLAERSLEEPYYAASFLNPNGPLETLDEKELLKFFLTSYLKRLGVWDIPFSAVPTILNRKKKANGLLPGQKGILALIESTFDIDSSKKQDFANKLNFDLRDAAPLYSRLAAAFDFAVPDNSYTRPTVEPKTWAKRIATSIKAAIFGAARGNTGAGLWIGPLLITGTIASGTPVGWVSLLISGIVVGLSGAASLIYKNLVEKPYKRSILKLNSEIKRHRTRVAILSKLENLCNKNYINYRDETAKTPSPVKKSDVEQVIPTATKARIIADTLIQGAYGASAGMVIGISITLVLSVLVVPYFPMLAFPLVGGIMTLTTVGASVGGIFLLRYGWIMGKQAHLAGKEEEQKIAEVNKKKQWLKQAFGKNEVKERIKVSKQEIVIELIERYNVLDSIETSSVTEREKMLQRIKMLRLIKEILIEEISDREERNTLLENNDSEFFCKSVSRWLQKNPITKPYADPIASLLKQQIMGPNSISVDTTVVEKTLPLLSRLHHYVKKAWQNNATYANRWTNKHIFGFIGSLGIAIPLGFMLFGPFALVPVTGVALSVIAVVLAHKYLESRQVANVEEYKAKEGKLPLIDRVLKLKRKTSQAPDEIVEKNLTISKALARARVVNRQDVSKSGRDVELSENPIHTIASQFGTINHGGEVDSVTTFIPNSKSYGQVNNKCTEPSGVPALPRSGFLVRSESTNSDLSVSPGGSNYGSFRNISNSNSFTFVGNFGKAQQTDASIPFLPDTPIPLTVANG